MQAGEVAGAGQVDVPGPAGRAGRGLIGVHRRSGPQQVPDAAGEPASFHQGGGPAADPGHPPGRDRHASELAQQHGGPVDGNVVAADQVRGQLAQQQRRPADGMWWPLTRFAACAQVSAP